MKFKVEVIKVFGSALDLLLMLHQKSQDFKKQVFYHLHQ
jgi:hypothetical protein